MVRKFAVAAVSTTLGFGILVGCPTPPKPAPRPAVADAGGCGPACSHLRSKRCELGEPTPRGVTCEELCTRVLEENGGLGFPTDCISKADSCVEAEACR